MWVAPRPPWVALMGGVDHDGWCWWAPADEGSEDTRGDVLDTRFALPPDTLLDGASRLVRVVGTRGFGITYEAEDINLCTAVAIKEYYPDEFGDRDAGMSVRAKSERHRKTFESRRANFL